MTCPRSGGISITLRCSPAAMRVAHDLGLDVARAREIFLDVHVAVAERRQGLGSRKLECARKIIRIGSYAHSLAAAARRSLDDDRETDVVRKAKSLVDVFHRSGPP